MIKVASRPISFFIILIGYIFATILGIMLYNHLSYSFWLNLLIADVAATIFIYLLGLIFNNASFYDPYWSVAPPVFLAVLAFYKPMNLMNWLFFAVITLWAVRLTANWAYTFHGLTHQDWRYTMLHEKTGRLYQLVNLLGIHLFPTLVVYMVMLPAIFVMREEPKFSLPALFFLLVSLGAVILQGTADYQMHRFRRSGPKGFINVGLWKHSRHPNYLGEILMWWGVALAAVTLIPHRWYLMAGALLNTIMFLTVSIPLADGRQARKDGFAAYKKATRALLPLPKFGK